MGAVGSYTMVLLLKRKLLTSLISAVGSYCEVLTQFIDPYLRLTWKLMGNCTTRNKIRYNSDGWPIVSLV